ncbi:MAG: long-chain fatty acid--CoA ligase, partial [Candidatus Eremiobacteraeota bacterium]|nr:long-chain fatty acid--CoA ligase [Candidatus Eremiobacteraeota bacterium]
IERLACAIRDAGLAAGDRVALISVDRVDWIVADFATLFAGCVIVPLFPTQALDHVHFILENSAAKLVFVDTAEAAQRLRSTPGNLAHLVVFDGEAEGCESLASFEARGAQLLSAHPEWPSAFETEVRPDDLAVLMYTSGTTGLPKGVRLSHDNVGFTAKSSFAFAFEEIERDAPVLSVLPFSHIYEHSIMYGYLLSGMRHYIVHSVDELLTDLRDVRPTAMTVVPRIFERMLAGIAFKAQAAGGFRARVVPWALATGRAYMTVKTRGGRPGPLLALRYALARVLVLKKIRPLLGLDRLGFFVSGSAPLHFDTAMTFLGFGVPIIEGYGPTECSPVITVNRLKSNRYGTVGKPIPGVQIKLAPDGEILARGRNVMQGYYRDDASTAAVMDDGWYKTGDIGEIESDGYLRITDRKKELFKTSGGKFVAPARVESAIKRSPYVNQVMLVGDGRAHPAALVAPNWELLKPKLDLPANASPADLASRADVLAFLTADVHKQTADLATFEQVRRIAVLPNELTIEAGELSPTLKVKRRVVESRYAAEIERVYAEPIHGAHA